MPKNLNDFISSEECFRELITMFPELREKFENEDEDHHFCPSRAALLKE